MNIGRWKCPKFELLEHFSFLKGLGYSFLPFEFAIKEIQALSLSDKLWQTDRYHHFDSFSFLLQKLEKLFWGLL